MPNGEVKPEPIVPYALTEEVTERIDYAGRIVVPLDEADVHLRAPSLHHSAYQIDPKTVVDLLLPLQHRMHELEQLIQ